LSRPGAALVGLLALTLWLGTASSLASPERIGDEPLTVYAAASLTDVFPRIDPDARYSFAGSNQLALQIRQGAPADVFASASPKYTQELYQAGLVGRPRTFATNSLVIVVPRRNPARIASVFDLARRPKLRLVVAGPKVPIGLYTREVLKRLGLLRVLRKTVSLESDVKGVVGKVALGEADAGFVYATDAKAVASRVTVVRLPRRSQPTVRYEVAVVEGSDQEAAAQSFVADLLESRGRRTLAAAGFGLP
jgi:molybdate transport system substrate-binding protein